MFKRNRKSEEEEVHGSRPWVFFMIDCFMLILQFFILTFHFRASEPVLPAKLPDEGPGIPRPLPPEKQPLVVRVKAGPIYTVDGVDASLQDLETTLSARCMANSATRLRISYEAQVPWGDVMELYDLAAKYAVHDVGLVPLALTEMPVR